MYAIRSYYAPGPVFEKPIRTAADVDALIVSDDMNQAVSYVPAIIKRLRQAFEGRVPLIDFGGAPFTLACYMVEGKTSPMPQRIVITSQKGGVGKTTIARNNFV